MKKYIYIISAIVILSSCDKDNANHPYLEHQGTGSEVAIVTVPVADAINTVIDKNILIEDYTGFKCTNCPEAHEVAEGILNTYGDRVSVLANHVSSSFAAPTAGSVYPQDEFSTDFRTEAGETYITAFDIQALPSGVVNRTKNGEFFEIGFTDWDTKVQSLLAEVSDVSIEASSVTFSNDTISMDMSFEFVNDIDGDYYFNIALVEDGVISYQKDGGEVIEDYVQNNVFRGALNGTWGEHIKMNPRKRDKAYIQGKYLLPPLFGTDEPNPQIQIERCHLLVYIYQSDSDNGVYEVIQLRQIDIEQ